MLWLASGRRPRLAVALTGASVWGHTLAFGKHARPALCGLGQPWWPRRRTWRSLLAWAANRWVSLDREQNRGVLWWVKWLYILSSTLLSGTGI